MTDLGWLALALATLPCCIGAFNLLLVRRATGPAPMNVLVSILIPARDEAANIGPCLDAARASRGVPIEVIVMDDGSRDGTHEIATGRAAADARVTVLRAPTLPTGWSGKVHACAQLALAARGTHLLFLDADVRLAPDGAAALAAHAVARDLAMVSGVPRQVLGSLGEALTVPMINLLLLGYLPGGGRAFTRHPALGAACGQLLMVEAAAYRRFGGHGAVRTTLHDGVTLPRAARAAGLRTEIVDGAPLAACRMYRGFRASWSGFAKNATEGMATPIGLPVWTVLLLGAHVLPWLLLPATTALVALLLGLALRAAITRRVREPWWTVALHPAGVLVALAIQWWALVRWAAGRPPGWKGRAYPATKAA